MTDLYRPPATELEALQRFAILVVSEAAASLSWHLARGQGGQHVGVPAMHLTEAQRILRPFRAQGLAYVSNEDGERIIWSNEDPFAPALGGRDA